MGELDWNDKQLAKLERQSASWVIRNKATGYVLCETFSSRIVAALNTAKYEAVPILEYLCEFNRKVKHEHTI